MPRPTRVNVHPAGEPRGWRVTVNGQPYAVFQTQGQAISYGKPLAQAMHGELTIHGRNGRIREGWSYGSDPFPPRG